MAVSDTIIKGVGALITASSLAFGIGSILGRSGEVAVVRKDVAAVQATQIGLGKAQDDLRADVKEDIADIKQTVERAADDAQQTRKIVEKLGRGGLRQAGGHPR